MYVNVLQRILTYVNVSPGTFPLSRSPISTRGSVNVYLYNSAYSGNIQGVLHIFYFLDLFIFFYNMSSYHNVLFSYFLHSWARESGSGFEAAARSPPGPGPPPLCGLGLGLGPRNVENMKRA